jgi:hypothetical protein
MKPATNSRATPSSLPNFISALGLITKNRTAVSTTNDVDSIGSTSKYMRLLMPIIIPSH